MFENIVDHLIPLGGSIVIAWSVISSLRSGQLKSVIHGRDRGPLTRAHYPRLYWGVVALFAVVSALTAVAAVATPWTNSN
jgi:hypothetical protein